MDAAKQICRMEVRIILQLCLDAFSTRFRVESLTETALPEVLSLCRQNPLYYRHMGIAPSIDNLRDVLRELPPGKTADEKYFVGFYEGARLAAVLDLIAQYPDRETAYIGWFMMHRALQGAGIGSAIVSELLSYLAAVHFQCVQLGYCKGNAQAEAFWRKNGFVPTGREVRQETHTVVCMKRQLQPPDTARHENA